RGLRRLDLALRNKLVEVTGDVENTAGGVVLHGYGETAFAGNQAKIANDRVRAVILGQMTDIKADAAAHPVAKGLQLWKAIARIKVTGSANDFLQFFGARRIFLGQMALEPSPQVCIEIETGGESAIAHIPNQILPAIIRTVSQ